MQITRNCLLFRMGTLVLMFVVCATFQNVQAQKQAYVQVHAGLYSAAVRDKAYSPLMYYGLGKGGGLAARTHQPSKTRYFAFSFMTGRHENRYAAGMNLTSMGIQTFTFYHSKDHRQLVQWGWSNQNAFTSRDLESVQNFNNRSEYHTSFGPAIKIAHEFKIINRDFNFQVMLHTQLLGFFLASSYVSSLPKGFEDRDQAWLSNVFSSMDLFYPGKATALGAWPSLRYTFGRANEFGISYNYDYLLINGSHQSQKSGGIWLVELHVAL